MSQLDIEIIKRVFNYFGFPKFISYPGSVLAEEYKIDREISIEMEDGEVIKKSIWGLTGKIQDLTIKALITDLSIDDEKELVLILQLNDLSVYALKFEDEMARAFSSYKEDGWIELTSLLLSKLLVGIEQLNEVFVHFNKIEVKEYDELYAYLISYLNYDEALPG